MSVFALLAAVCFGIGAFRWFFEHPTATSQAGWLCLGLMFLALHFAWTWTVQPRMGNRPPPS